MGWEARKIKRSMITQSYTNGGLKMPNVEQFIKSLKCTWIRRLVNSSDSPWVKLFELSYCPVSELLKYGPFYKILYIYWCRQK